MSNRSRRKQHHHAAGTPVRSHGHNYYLDWNTFVSEPDIPRLRRDRTGSWWYTPGRTYVDHPQEFVTIDQVHAYRKRQFSEAHAKHIGSNFSLYNKSEPSLPTVTGDSQRRTEYSEQYHRRRPSVYERAAPLRRSTSLHIEPGTMKGLSENHSKFVSYSQDTIVKSKPAAVRPEENFQLPDGGTTQGTGLANASSEYKASFLPYDFLPEGMEQRFRHRSEPAGKRDDLSASDSKLHNKEQLTRSNLRLSGEATFEPEYKRQYGLPPVSSDKSRSTPQLNNIAFTGNFREAPSEYKECYKYYDHFTKSAPIRKFDNLSLHGTIEFRPEYKESYRELPPGAAASDHWRSHCIVRKDNLSLKGDFLGREPEYSYSFRNPHIKCKPEKAKPKDNFLAMQGDMDYTPMYRCSYIDYPRSRPHVKKPVCSINLEDVYEKTPHRRSSRRTSSPIKYNVHATGTTPANTNTTNAPGTTGVIPGGGNKGDVLQTFVAQPEYRKAQREMMIKKRSPPKERGSLLAQKILQDGHLPPNQQPAAPLPIVQVQDTTATNEGYATTTASSSTGIPGTTTTTTMATNRRQEGRAPSPLQLPVRIAKHGRRAKSPIIAIQRENEPIIFYKDLHRKGGGGDHPHGMRNRTKVIEANAAYRRSNLQPTARGIVKKPGTGDKLKTGTQSFVVLNAPAKRRTTRWAEPATIYDSHFY